MSSHTVRVNNFMKVNEKPTIDPLSKVFIAIQWLFGLNRIGLLSKRTILHVLSTFYGLFLISGIVYVMASSFIQYPEIVKVIQCVVCGVLCYTSRNKMRLFYEELNKFDNEVEHKPKVSRRSIVIFLSMVVICIVSVAPLIWPHLIIYMPLHIIHAMENHYYGFLFNLLNERLQLINNRIESSLISNPNFAMTTKVGSEILDNDNTKSELAMNKLMDFYYIIINAYDLLTDCIKWQLLFIITTSFTYTLFISYISAIEVLGGDYRPVGVVAKLVLVSAEALPLLAPCMCCDQVRHEVRRLRELLASKLFESKLDKANRSVARALLALTKARNLSFSLLRMVDISISLPFSFLGLIATYLIILLQFEKVVNPNERLLALNNMTTTA